MEEHEKKVRVIEHLQDLIERVKSNDVVIESVTTDYHSESSGMTGYMVDWMPVARRTLIIQYVDNWRCYGEKTHQETG